MPKRTTSGAVTSVVAMRAFKLKGDSIAKGAVLQVDDTRLKKARLDSLIGAGWVKVTNTLPIRSTDRDRRSVHVQPHDHRKAAE